jgi:hypothetical protein
VVVCLSDRMKYIPLQNSQTQRGHKMCMYPSTQFRTLSRFLQVKSGFKNWPPNGSHDFAASDTEISILKMRPSFPESFPNKQLEKWFVALKPFSLRAMEISKNWVCHHHIRRDIPLYTLPVYAFDYIIPRQGDQFSPTAHYFGGKSIWSPCHQSTKIESS